MDQTFERFRPMALSLFRFITGLLLFQYGVAKIFKFPALPYFENIPPLITIAGVIELIGGGLLLLGLFTRPAAFILAGEMAFAYFLGHMFKGRRCAGFPPAVQWRHRGHPVLLRLPLSRHRRRRPVEPRRDAAEEGLTQTHATKSALFAARVFHPCCAGRGAARSGAQSRGQFGNRAFVSIPVLEFSAPRCIAPGTRSRQPGTFNSSGTAASYLELCSTSEVLTLRTCGARSDE